VKSKSLLEFGPEGEHHNGNYSLIQDVYARVGSTEEYEVKTGIMVQVNSDNVIIDNTWLWRADQTLHGGHVQNGSNPAEVSL
jgi:hypothetical protein